MSLVSSGSATSGTKHDLLRGATAEPAWREWVARLPRAELRPRSVLIVSPHPDDETLGLGAALADWAAADISVRVVAVTDGEGSHPGRPGLGPLRCSEQNRALAELGIVHPPIRLRLPDTDLARHSDELVAALVDLTECDDLVVAPWEHDGHGDHDAVGMAAAKAAQRTGAGLASYPIWAWQWARPSDLEGLALHRIQGSHRARTAKAAAIAHFRSQLDPYRDCAPILPPGVVAHFRRIHEVLAVRPRA